jgi:glycosyltransferase involved in cell wall biosynthesis
MTADFIQTITVVIPTFNRSLLLLESLESILTQSVTPDRIMVVNDGSSDDTEQVLQPYLDRIDYVYQENGGKPKALNNALGRISEGWIWVFDDDDIALPNALELHIEALRTEPSAKFTHSAFWFAKTDPEGGLAKLAFEPSPDLSEQTLFDALLDDCVISVPGMLVKEECYRKVGGYDEDLMRAEDYEFFLRLAREFEGVIIEEATYLRRVHEGIRGSGSNSHDAKSIQQHFLRYESLIFDKLHAELPLSSYAMHKYLELPESKRTVRRAILKRASCMFRKGLWAHGLSDLRELNDQEDNAPLTSDEKRICFKAFAPELIPYALSESRQTMNVFRRDLTSNLLQDVKAEMARGLTSRLVRDVRLSGLKPIVTWFRIIRYYGLRAFTGL